MSRKLGEKSKPLDFINTRCQLGAESLYIKTWALLQREDFPTELDVLFFFFYNPSRKDRFPPRSTCSILHV